MELSQPGQHSEPSSGKAQVPILFFSQGAAYQWAECSSQIYPHIKYRKTSIAPGTALRVQFPNEGTHIRLQHSTADNHKNQPQIERLSSWQREGKVAERNNESSVPN